MKKLLSKAGINKKELIIIGFLLAAFGAGIAVKYSGWKKPSEYDYSQSDKNFENRLKSSFEELNAGFNDSIALTRKNEIIALADSLELTIEKNPVSKKLPSGKININSASAKELSELPGIGEVTAEKIIEFRELNGSFKTAEEIMKVKGIGEKKFNELKEYITAE